MAQAIFLLLLQLLLHQLFFLQTTVSTTFQHKINPRLSPFPADDHHNNNNRFVASINSKEDFKTYHYTQTLDHFNYGPHSYATFKQRYVVNSKYWDGPNSTSPIFAYLGAEAPLDGELDFNGFLNDIAPYFKSLSVYIEHRFYGESIPFGSMEEAMKDNTTRGYFNSAQALADYAEILLHVKKMHSAHTSPIIVVGGSYGGMLASWFRLKYPHIALGALASSAPILYFDNITPQNGYYSIVTNDFKEVSWSCYEAIRKSWAEIDKVASKPGGLSTLSRRFKTCSHLNSSDELKNLLDSMYTNAAQYNAPPYYPVSLVCKGIDDHGEEKTDDDDDDDDDILGRIFAGVVSYRGKRKCYDDPNEDISQSETNMGWQWQTCSELVIPIGTSSENDTMFPEAHFDLDEYSEECESVYGVPPRPHWITTYYGGDDAKLVLKRFGSNIIFSNGLRDPWSSGGVLKDVSKSVVAVTTDKGSHCLDIHKAEKTDPKWLVEQRKTELKIIQGWLKTYYDDLHIPEPSYNACIRLCRCSSPFMWIITISIISLWF